MISKLAVTLALTTTLCGDSNLGSVQALTIRTLKDEKEGVEVKDDDKKEKEVGDADKKKEDDKADKPATEESKEAGAESDVKPTEGEESSTEPTEDGAKEAGASEEQQDGKRRCISYKADLIEKESGRLVSLETVMKTIDVKAKDKDVKLEIFEGSTYIPYPYMKIGKDGYLTDMDGNLVTDQGVILTTRDEVAELLSRMEAGEDIGEDLKQLKGVLMVKIFEEGDSFPAIPVCGEGDMKKDGEKSGDEGDDESGDDTPKEIGGEDKDKDEKKDDEKKEGGETPEKDLKDGDVKGC